MNVRHATTWPILLSPGPVMLSDSVKYAAAETVICHRDPAFSGLHKRTTNNLKKIIHATDKYQALLLTGSGTAANEAVISSMATLGNILVLANGEFGERLGHLSKLYNKTSQVIRFEWGKAIDVEPVEEILASGDFSIVAMVHHETSTGMLNPIASIAKIARKFSCYIFVDAVSSLGADNIRVSDWNIDVITSSSGKALAAMPGIGIVIAKHELFARISKTQPVNHYFNLANYYKMACDKQQTPNTPAVHLIAALEAATKESLDGSSSAIHQRARYFRKMLRKNDVRFFDYQANTSSVLTCVSLPEHVPFEKIVTDLYTQNIVVYGGKGPLTGKIVQIGHIGFFASDEYMSTLDTVLDTLAFYGVGTPRSSRR